MTVNRITLLDGASAAGQVGSPAANLSSEKTFDFGVTGVGAISATIVIEVRNLPMSIVGLENTGWTQLLLVPLTGADSVSGGGVYNVAPWHLVRARLVGISGTNAKAYAAVAHSVGS